MIDLDTAKATLAPPDEPEAARVAATGPADWHPTGDPEVDARRQEAINELGRQLTPEESIRVAEGRSYVAPPAAAPLLPSTPSPLTPEQQFKLAAEAAEEVGSQA